MNLRAPPLKPFIYKGSRRGRETPCLSGLQRCLSANTLSGSEAQRVKLALELSKRDTSRTLYILNKPTTSLHFADIALLLEVIGRLKGKSNSIVIIEHNLDVIKTADWIVDLGPEGDDGGGRIIASGSPKQVASMAQNSYTARYLKDISNKN